MFAKVGLLSKIKGRGYEFRRPPLTKSDFFGTLLFVNNS